MKLTALFESTEFQQDGQPLGVRTAGPQKSIRLRMEISQKEFDQLDPQPVQGDDGSRYDTPVDWINAMKEYGAEVIWMDRFQAHRRAKDIGDLRQHFAKKGWRGQAYAAAAQEREWHRKARQNQ